MSDPIPLQNASAAAYMEIDDSTVSYGSNQGPGGRPLVRILVGGTAGIKGMSEVEMGDGLNILDADEYKKAIITLNDDSIITSAIAEMPEVESDTTGAYQRTFRNRTGFDITIRSGANDFVLGDGLNQTLLFMVDAIEAAVTGI